MPSPYIEHNGTVFFGNGAGSLYTIQLTRNDRLQTAAIVYTRSGVLATRAEMENDIEYIEYLVGSGVQRKIDVAKLFTIMDEQGETIDDGYIDMDFVMRGRRSEAGEDLNTLNLEILAPVTFRVKVANQVTMDLVGGIGESPGLEISLLKMELTRDAKNERQVETQKMMVSHVQKDLQITSLSKEFSYEGSGRAIMALRFFTNTITEIQIEKAGSPVQKFTLATLQHFQRKAGLTPQAGMVTILGETLRGRFSDGDTLKNLPLKVTLTLSANTDFTAMVEEMGQPIA